MALGSCTVIELESGDNLASLRRRLAYAGTGRVAVVVHWDLEFLARDIDFELLQREADRRRLDIAIVSADPERRKLARRCGFSAFGSIGDARDAADWRSRSRATVEPPPQPWWREPVDTRPKPSWPTPPWMRWAKLGMRLLVFLVAVAVVGGAAYGIVPSAEVTLLPAGKEYTMIVPVTADPDVEDVDAAARLMPARRVGTEIEGFIEVETTGRLNVALGRTRGEVLFTNLLFQEYVVPAGTVVRTSSTSYPIRFHTTEDVRVPAAGQATAPIESLADGVGNVAAYQINQIEGTATSAVRVINSQPTTGSDATEVRIVTQADRDRAREQLLLQMLGDAHVELSNLDVLAPSEFVPRQSLIIQAVPKEAYTRFVGEQADTVGLELRLLVSGLAVDIENAKIVAQSELSRRLPEGYRLVDTWFELGEVAEEDVGPGEFTLFVTAQGYASAELDTQHAVDTIKGQPVDEARQLLFAELPLAQPPLITLWPEQLARMPLLPMRIAVSVIPFRESGGLAVLSK